MNSTILKLRIDVDLEKLYRNVHLYCVYVIAIPGVVLNMAMCLFFFGRKAFWENGNKMGILYSLKALSSALPLLTEALSTLINVDEFFENKSFNLKIIRFFAY
jgi:hypothetical protein